MKGLQLVIKVRSSLHQKPNRISQNESYQLLRLLLLAELTNEIFADQNKAQRWLNKQKRKFNNQTHEFHTVGKCRSIG